MHAISDLGFEYCTPIQEKVFAHEDGNANIAGRAQTGTGKTVAFLTCNFPAPSAEQPPSSLDATPLPPLFELVEGMGRPISDWLRDAAEGRGLLKPEIVRAVVPGQELFLQIALGRTIENDKDVLVGILNDATELKTLEAQFVQSQKMQAIG